MVTLYFNYLGRKTAIVDVFVYASLAITVVSAFHYLIQVVQDRASAAALKRVTSLRRPTWPLK